MIGHGGLLRAFSFASWCGAIISTFRRIIFCLGINPLGSIQIYELLYSDGKVLFRSPIICSICLFLRNQHEILHHRRSKFRNPIFKSRPSFWTDHLHIDGRLVMFGPYGSNMLESQSNFLHLIIIIIIFLSPRLQRQFTSNLLQTSAQWSLGIHLPD